MEQLKEEYQLPVYLFHEGKNYEAYRFLSISFQEISRNGSLA